MWIGGQGSLMVSLFLVPKWPRGICGAKRQPGLDPRQEHTINLGGWLSRDWGLQPCVLFGDITRVPKAAFGRGGATNWSPGCAQCCLATELNRKMGHPGPTLLPVSDGGTGWQSGGSQLATGLASVRSLGKQNGSEGGERVGGCFYEHPRGEDAGAQAAT